MGSSPPSLQPELAAASAALTLRKIYSTGVNLQCITSEIASLAEMLGDEDPEVVAEATTNLELMLSAEDETQLKLSDRCDIALALADQLMGQGAIRRAQSKRLLALAQADDATVERLQSVAMAVLKAAFPGQTKVSLPMHELTSRGQTNLVIDEDACDIEQLDEGLIRTKKEFDKNAIKAFLKAGGVLPGCSMVSGRSWSVK